VATIDIDVIESMESYVRAVPRKAAEVSDSIVNEGSIA
jgi:hypothetical protein